MQAVSVSSEMGHFALLGGESTALVPLEVTQGCLSQVLTVLETMLALSTSERQEHNLPPILPPSEVLEGSN